MLSFLIKLKYFFDPIDNFPMALKPLWEYRQIARSDLNLAPICGGYYHLALEDVGGFLIRVLPVELRGIALPGGPLGDAQFIEFIL